MMLFNLNNKLNKYNKKKMILFNNKMNNIKKNLINNI